MTRNDLRILLCSASLVAMLAGCGPFPTSGPQVTSEPIAVSDPQEVLPHVLVKATPDVVGRVNRYNGGSETLGSFTSRGGSADIRLGVGDTVGVTIFEAAAGGLFIPTEAGSRAGNFVALPDQTVDRRGTISVPYAGLIQAVGRTAPEVQAEIEQKLRNRAIEPQAVVSIKDQKATQVSVLGEVNAPARLAVNPSGEKVLDVIARAGGPKGYGYQSYVTLQRGKVKKTIYFKKLVDEPANNVYVEPGDTVYVFTENRTYVVLGATGLNGKYDFESEKTSATEALGKAGGLLDERANPTAVYIYRLESRKAAADLGVDLSKWPAEGPVPVIYQFDLRAENGFFTLGQFLIRDKDVLYVDNAASVEWVKALNVVRTGVAAVNETNVARYNLHKLP